ncbi:hypothetical protein PC129_g2644 [Phytophthora cactorum]|uniref:Uncharacterized protein n=1 Tax=Phytophthora cactorum TaxID=29920 RepID=A0A329ST17_9STRA|nr:hypothetical protein Pcac1_g10229 [Phytophthora cactorum]KAG2840218.1 hypothetical protein PC111_g3561 [Phytophthora cactorum]KAG2846551.1 hypothetical protein PC112_g1449 [Phytophthora cactorum]KAG2868835.1 hypothetical protein PC113_g740 [Phytophthora cactorum]KAG2928601.1 hypothetical protein PC114_g3046 [Phytophthora cactorum]
MINEDDDGNMLLVLCDAYMQHNEKRAKPAETSTKR